LYAQRLKATVTMRWRLEQLSAYSVCVALRCELLPHQTTWETASVTDVIRPSRISDTVHVGPTPSDVSV